MPITFVNGKFGGGKSFYIVDIFRKELWATWRPLITNFALNWAHLQEELDKDGYTEHCERNGYPADILHRIKFLEDEECHTFWRWRARWVYDLDENKQRRHVEPGNTDSPPLRQIEWYYVKYEQTRNAEGFETWVKFGPHLGDCGAFRCVDDAQDFFRSHDWQKFGAEATHHIYQHRKLIEDIVIATPYLEYIVKPLRIAGQEYIEVRNLGVENIGRFRLPQLFQRTCFGRPPSGRGDTAQWRTHVRCDWKRWGKCYNTGGGAGIAGRQADIGRRAKGLPWWLLIVGAFVLLVLVCGVAPRYLIGKATGATAAGLTAIIGGGKQAATVPAPASATVATVSAEKPKEAPPALAARVQVERESPGRESLGPTVTGYARLEDGRSVFLLSDGQQLWNPIAASGFPPTLWDGEKLTYNGKVYRRAR